MAGLIDTRKYKDFQDRRKGATIQDPELRRLVQRARIRLVKDQLKEARVGEFTIMADEAVERGGSGSAPGPLSYFCAAIGF